jgi:hypothetical protein
MEEGAEFLMLGPECPNNDENSGCAILFLIALLLYIADKC